MVRLGARAALPNVATVVTGVDSVSKITTKVRRLTNGNICPTGITAGINHLMLLVKCHLANIIYVLVR
jgi:hypothetical protein